MDKKIRILQVVTRMGRGGAESMIMNYYRALNRDKYQFDFLVHRTERSDFDDEIELMGGRIYRAFPIRPWSYAQYFRFLDNFFKEHAGEYVAVHAHIQENSGIVLKYASKYGVKNRLCTSHIADLGFDYKYIFRLYGKTFNKYITQRLACGVEAGRFLYGKKSFSVFPNAIDAEKYIYNPTKDIQFREEKGWRDKLIIGNVARFGYQKNHTFLIDIFNELHKKCVNSILVLVGDGDLREKMQEKVKQLGLTDVVFFEGIRSNVEDYMNVFNVFLFPSLFEGLPVSVIEAQASGTKCFLSDTIDSDVDITKDIVFLSLKKSAEDWANRIIEGIPYQKNDYCSLVKQQGYDVKTNIERLINLYLQ